MKKYIIISILLFLPIAFSNASEILGTLEATVPVKIEKDIKISCGVNATLGCTNFYSDGNASIHLRQGLGLELSKVVLAHEVCHWMTFGKETPTIFTSNEEMCANFGFWVWYSDSLYKDRPDINNTFLQLLS